ncbi:MAG: NAD(P)H-hydrate epimerase [Chloroflexi bacterium]|nr:NAD(P)H-hydrate epimerase [Chloroflexota bacterium]
MASPTRARHRAPEEPPSSRGAADDPQIFELDLTGLARRWADAMNASPISAETMTGTDRRAQALGVPGWRLMEHAGAASAAVVRALAAERDRWGRGPILVLAGPGNNGGDGFVAARHLASLGPEVIVVLVASEPRPRSPDSARAWDRLDKAAGVTRMHAPAARDLAVLGRGVERASVVVDALLGTGVKGPLRDPVLSAVALVRRARAVGVPVVALDTPTAVDLTTGEASDPVVRADATVTFHRPKLGLRTRASTALAGRILVAPIGIPPGADRG